MRDAAVEDSAIMDFMELAVKVRIEHLPEGFFLATPDDLPGLPTAEDLLDYTIIVGA